MLKIIQLNIQILLKIMKKMRQQNSQILLKIMQKMRAQLKIQMLLKIMQEMKRAQLKIHTLRKKHTLLQQIAVGARLGVLSTGGDKQEDQE